MLQFSSRTLLVVSSLLLSPTAWGHGRLMTPSPRTSGGGLSTVPCGAAARTAKPAQYAPGQRVMVAWEELAIHPGHFRLAFSPANDQGFDANVLADNIPNPSGKQNGSMEVTLPNVECAACTLQLTMVMTDSNPPQRYYSCADIALVRTSPPPVDAGTPQVDAGSPGSQVDAGSPGSQVDAGSPGSQVDAGSPGSQVDAGSSPVPQPTPNADAGNAATTVPSTGHEHEQGTTKDLDGEETAGCSASGGAGSLAALGVLLLGMLGAARRSRRSR